MKVNAFIMGTQKGGTTALFAFLASHPEISATRKEPHFFDSGDFPEDPNVSVNYSEYHTRLVSMDAHCCLEATPIYMYWRPVRDRLYRYNPEAKLIFLLRRPWDRAHSHWRMSVARGLDKVSFEDALKQEADWSNDNPNAQSREWSYVDRGYYAKQIQRLLERFELSQMLFLTTGQLREQHVETLDRVCDFVGVTRFRQYPVARTILPDVAPVEIPRMTQETQARLVKLFTSDLEQLAELPGLDLAEWLA